MKTRAICTGVDPVAGKCLVQFPLPSGSDLQPRVIAMRYKAAMPAPLTYVEVEEVKSGSWICNGSQANIEQRMFEDWDTVHIDPADDTINGRWLTETSEIALSGVTAYQSEYGAIDLTTSTGSGDYVGVVRDLVSAAEDLARGTAWWLEAKISADQTTSRVFGAGFHGPGDIPFSTDPALFVQSDTAAASGAFRLVATDGGVTVTADTAVIPAAGTFYIVQIMFLADWAAAWIVESSTAAEDVLTTVHGPFVVTSNINQFLSPSVFVKTLTTAARTMDCDYIRLSTVTPVVHPFAVLSA